jgi:hypothetical protein
MSLWRKRGTGETIAPFARHDGQKTPKLFTMTATTDNDLSIKSDDLSIKSKEHMKYEDIKDFYQRCEEHPDHQSGMITYEMIQQRLNEEIDELREFIEQKLKENT